MRATRKSGLGSRTLSTLGVLLAPGAAVSCVALTLLPRAGEPKGCLDRLRLEGFAPPLFLACVVYRFLKAGWARKPQEGFTYSLASPPFLITAHRPYP
jgi:hypothetical protein